MAITFPHFERISYAPTSCPMPNIVRATLVVALIRIVAHPQNRHAPIIAFHPHSFIRAYAIRPYVFPMPQWYGKIAFAPFCKGESHSPLPQKIAFAQYCKGNPSWSPSSLCKGESLVVALIPLYGRPSWSPFSIVRSPPSPFPRPPHSTLKLTPFHNTKI